MNPTHINADLATDVYLIANPDVVLREEEDEAALLFDPDTGAVHILNSTAVAVWQLLDGKRDLSQIMADLHEEFDGMDDTAEGQVVELLNHLMSIGAVGVLI